VLLVYVWDEASDVVAVVTIHDARSARPEPAADSPGLAVARFAWTVDKIRLVVQQRGGNDVGVSVG